MYSLHFLIQMSLGTVYFFDPHYVKRSIGPFTVLSSFLSTLQYIYELCSTKYPQNLYLAVLELAERREVRNYTFSLLETLRRLV